MVSLHWWIRKDTLGSTVSLSKVRGNHFLSVSISLSGECSINSKGIWVLFLFVILVVFFLSFRLAYVAKNVAHFYGIQCNISTHICMG